MIQRRIERQGRKAERTDRSQHDVASGKTEHNANQTTVRICICILVRPNTTLKNQKSQPTIIIAFQG